MKKNKLIVIINWSLLFAIPITLLTVNVKQDVISKKMSTKKLSTSIMFNTNKSNPTIATEVKDEQKEEVIVEEEKKQKPTEKQEIKEEKQEVKKEEETVPVIEEKSDVIKSYTGKMSFYNANCRGCSGVTSTGTDISDGKLFFSDSSYGNVRIIAAGLEIPKWSIVRLKNTSLGNNVLAIVLDRGGAIGEGKTFLIDMLTNSSENKGGVEKNIVVEVIREGK